MPSLKSKMKTDYTRMAAGYCRFVNHVGRFCPRIRAHREIRTPMIKENRLLLLESCGNDLRLGWDGSLS